MSDHDKWFSYFFGGSFIVAILIAILYRAIETTTDIFAFFFLSSLIVMFFTTFLLESIILDPVIDRIIEEAEGSRFIYNFLFFSLFVSIVIAVPATIVQIVNIESENKRVPNSNNCFQVVDQIFDSPKLIYNQRILFKCQYTKPLAKIFSTENIDTKKDIQDLLNIVDEYLEIISKNLSFAITLLLAIFGGASYLVIAGLAVKKGGAVLLALFSAIAVKMFFDGTPHP